jgi:hypothetical protein
MLNLSPFSRSIIGAISLFFFIGTLGFFGAPEIYGFLLGEVAGSLAGLFGTSVHFDGEVLVVVRDAESLLYKSLRLHPNFSYSALPLLVGILVATPGLQIRERILFSLITPGGILLGQSFLLVGFSFLDTSTSVLYSASKSTYTAWWGMGPLIFAGWWFWTNWLPRLIATRNQS